MQIWKKLLAAVTAGVMLTVGVPQMQFLASAEESYTYGDLTYAFLEDGTIKITGCDMNVTEVEIPAEIDGAAVTMIGYGSFRWCSITNIIIPESVTTISAEAFWGNENLINISIPNTVTYIGSDAFADTPWLEAQRRENPFVVVNGILVDGKTSGDIVTLPETVTSIGGGAFYFCTALSSITIPNSVTSIGDEAFWGCDSLTEIHYAGTEEQWTQIEISEYAFESYPVIYFKEDPLATTTTSELSVTTVSSSVQLDDGILYGDINQDGRLDITDAVLLNKASAGAVKLNDVAAKNADCNANGELGTDDAILLLEFLVHLISTLPYTE